MARSPTRVSCKPLFQKLRILVMQSQYILSFMTLLVNTLHYYTFKSTIHEINTRKKLITDTNSQLCILPKRCVLCKYKNI